jgi:stage III sporulation protein AG
VFKNKLINSIGKDDSSRKKKTENMIVLIILLVITFFAIKNIWSEDGEEKENSNIFTGDTTLASAQDMSFKIEENSTEFEKRLENILKTIKNVGEVKVLINYSETSEVIAMYNETINENTTEEADSNGGTRVSTDVQTSKEVIMEDAGSGKTPVTQKIKMPRLEGAIITATGANDATVKTNIINAVQAVTDLPSHKIQVFEMSN